eukprot:TRINITY_DN16913_c0_g1_i1.p2 TRINITY_DN16913_c0_g1~~TRINITY_DN16913_c0_g1_i1.p2  ORF type:complete len:242 (-),score=97.78 TRINITY_DN16913_c0_g1_i1:1132-1857(-)
MIRRPPRSTQGVSSAASDVYKRQGINAEYMGDVIESAFILGIGDEPDNMDSNIMQKDHPIPKEEDTKLEKHESNTCAKEEKLELVVTTSHEEKKDTEVQEIGSSKNVILSQIEKVEDFSGKKKGLEIEKSEIKSNSESNIKSKDDVMEESLKNNYEEKEVEYSPKDQRKKEEPNKNEIVFLSKEQHIEKIPLKEESKEIEVVSSSREEEKQNQIKLQQENLIKPEIKANTEQKKEETKKKK